MKYLLDDVMRERTMTIDYNEDIGCLTLEIKDDENGVITNFAMDDIGLFELIGVLHHLQKQMNQ